MTWRSLFRPLARLWHRLVAPRIVYGMRSGDGRWRAHSRISTHACIEHPQSLRLGDHVFIGHFSVLDASGGLEIGDGCQVTNHVSVLTHSTHRALRLGREDCWGDPSPPGLVRAPTRLGAWTFVGPHSVIAPGARIGRGVLVKAYSHVRGEVPDFAVVEGQPARVVGDTRTLDADWLAAQGAAVGEDSRRAWTAWVEAPDRPAR
ncbi:MAG: acyltransferase [Rubrivivax sp.]|nr:acyltransferase [Rubrivivax sp.]